MADSGHTGLETIPGYSWISLDKGSLVSRATQVMFVRGKARAINDRDFCAVEKPLAGARSQPRNAAWPIDFYSLRA